MNVKIGSRGGRRWSHEKEKARNSKSLSESELPRRDGRSGTPALECCMNKKFLLHEATPDSLSMQ